VIRVSRVRLKRLGGAGVNCVARGHDGQRREKGSGQRGVDKCRLKARTDVLAASVQPPSSPVKW
jgi:hypothetical protein